MRVLLIGIAAGLAAITAGCATTRTLSCNFDVETNMIQCVEFIDVTKH